MEGCLLMMGKVTGEAIDGQWGFQDWEIGHLPGAEFLGNCKSAPAQSVTGAASSIAPFLWM